MKKIAIILLITGFSFIAQLSFSQDIILLKNGSELKAKVLEINPLQIKYKMFSNINGPTYVVNKSDVVRITYEDGTADVFQIVDNTKKTEKTPLDFDPNVIRFHFFDVVYSDFTVSYERIVASGKLGIQIPVGIGFNSNYATSNFNLNNQYYSGIGLNFYPTGNTRFQYLAGPSFRFGNGYSYVNQVKTDMFYWRFLLNNGFVLNLTNTVNLTAIASLGLVHYSKDTENYQKGFNRSAFFSVMVGYRFK